MIGIVDYGLGNIQAILNIYKILNIRACRIIDGDSLNRSTHIILPGVGSFDWAIQKLNESGLKKKLDEVVYQNQKPVLGICVGMQIMAQGSEEGDVEGLSWVQGYVKKFKSSSQSKKILIPHMGWNNIEINKKSHMFNKIDKRAKFYFLHSYYFSEKQEKDVLAYTNYHGNFCSSFSKNNLFGVQFHPEKSHVWGIQLLKNFSSI